MFSLKKIIFSTVFTVILLNLTYQVSSAEKIDDWNYTAPARDSLGSSHQSSYDIIFLIVLIIVVVAIILASIYLLRKKSTWAKAIGIALIILLILGGIFVFLFSFMTGTFSSQTSLRSPDGIGFSVGGAKDIDNFRKNVENDYLPLPTDITYEGLFYDYYFDTGDSGQCSKLFCPSYTYAVSADPLSKNKEYYMSVNLNSNLKESDFQRKKLNLVIVLDISGSMSSSFDKYYYDKFKNGTEFQKNYTKDDFTKRKIEVAKESIIALLGHLKDDDRLGIVLFESDAHLAKSLNLVGNTDMEKLKGHIRDLEPTGGTDMTAGMKMGTELFDEILNNDQSEYENRIIFLTDAQPNTGDISETGMLGITKGNAENKIYSTFIGIGVDFNTELVETITKIRGANYYSVHSSSEFKDRMDNEFEYMVTPLVFNLQLNLDAKGYEIEKVYGSPEANESTNTIMKVNTLFPSKKIGEETRGGIVLLELKKLSNDSIMRLKVSYEDRNGKMGSDEVTINLQDRNPEYFKNLGIRKGILLSRYANLMKNWINDERQNYQTNKSFVQTVTTETGITIPIEVSLGKWERQSIPLRVSNSYKSLIRKFDVYFNGEINAIGDDTLVKEVKILDKLSNFPA